MFDFNNVIKEEKTQVINFCDLPIGETFMTYIDHEDCGLSLDSVYFFIKSSDKDAIKLNRDDITINPVTKFTEKSRVIIITLQVSKISVE